MWIYAAAGLPALWLAHRALQRLRLSKAKHRSLRGHARMSQFVARLVRGYEYDEARFFRADDAPEDVADRRRAGFARLRDVLQRKAPLTLEESAELEQGVSDVDFTNAYRVPFQFRALVRRELRVGNLVDGTRGVQVRDLDGNWSYDLGGAYGVNLFGYDFYKRCIERGAEKVRDLGPVLGAYHPVIAANVKRLKAISGLDEVSFHMSGTEAVMQAVRLARYHTGRSHVVRFTGAYHGWWDGVQPGVGNPRPPREIYTLKEMDDDTLGVLRSRKDIACVLVNPIQAMHPNGQAPSDSTLVASDRNAHYDRHAYARWLQALREACTQRGIVLIFDEVFVGFRLAYGGAQQYFGVRADIVTYGKSVGGGLPIGVVCGRRDLMKRYRADKPTDICFARGTFNSHPYVMGAMSEFLDHVDQAEVRAHYDQLDESWDGRVATLNAQLAEHMLPVRFVNMTSIWTTLYTSPSCYNWMFQYYLRAEGLSLSWIGSGRFIFSHNYTEDDVREVGARIVRAAQAMQADGWWWNDGSQSNRTIKRRILREMVKARFSS